jgi:hypothetical protein
MEPCRRRIVAAGTGAVARLGTHGPASCGHPRCRGRATCVHGRGHCGPPAGRRDRNIVPGCEASSRGIHSSRADRIEGRGKKICCVTTRRRNLWVLNGLGRGLRPLAARALSLCVLGSDKLGLAAFILPPRRLPAANQPQALRLLAVALITAPRLVFTPATFAQAGSRARPAPSGLGTVLSLNVVGAHGRCFSQG